MRKKVMYKWAPTIFPSHFLPNWTMRRWLWLWLSSFEINLRHQRNRRRKQQEELELESGYFFKRSLFSWNWLTQEGETDEKTFGWDSLPGEFERSLTFEENCFEDNWLKCKLPALVNMFLHRKRAFTLFTKSCCVNIPRTAIGCLQPLESSLSATYTTSNNIYKTQMPLLSGTKVNWPDFWCVEAILCPLIREDLCDSEPAIIFITFGKDNCPRRTRALILH